jgi:hypothetical protein
LGTQCHVKLQLHALLMLCVKSVPKLELGNENETATT